MKKDGQYLNLIPLLEPLKSNIIEFKNIIEFASLLAGKKKVIRLAVNQKSHKIISELIKKHYNHLYGEVSPFELQTVFQSSKYDFFHKYVERKLNSKNDFIFYIGSIKYVKKAVFLEVNNNHGKELSNLFGYPPCCSKIYQSISINKNEVWFNHFFAKHQAKSFSYLNNRFSSLLEPMLTYQYDYFPCTPVCEHTKKLCAENRKIMMNSDLAEFIPIIDSHMKSFIISFNDMIWYIPRHILNKKKYDINKNFQKPLINNGLKEMAYLKQFDFNNHDCKFEIDNKQFLGDDKLILVKEFK